MSETFLILGASSFYGSTFADYVEIRGDKAIRLSRPEWDMRDGIDIAMHCPTYIVNFVSESLVAESWENPAKWVTTNTAVLASLLQIIESGPFPIKKFIHVSTPEVYGDMERWSDESHPFNPSTPYAVSRAAADMMLMAFHRAYGFPAIITRTANIYGIGQKPPRIIPLAYETFRRGEKLLLHGNGHTRRSFVHVRDAAAATYLIAKNGDPGQTYHISTQRDVSINELARIICKRLGLRPEDHIGSQPDRLGKDHAYLLDSTKLRNMGWRDTIQLEKGLSEWDEN